MSVYMKNIATVNYFTIKTYFEKLCYLFTRQSVYLTGSDAYFYPAKIINSSALSDNIWGTLRTATTQEVLV